MIDRPASGEPSPALLAAQARLEQLRAELAPGKANPPPSRSGVGSAAAAIEEGLSTIEPALILQLPAHLGWGSRSVSKAVRQALGARRRGTGLSPRMGVFKGAGFTPRQTGPDGARGRQKARVARPDPAVKLYPGIALGMLRQGQAAPGRLWLLLGHLDPLGRGWLAVDYARDRLTGRKSPTRAVGWRQMRNLLRQGQGIFWHRDRERIWLRSAAKVAAALGVTHLSGRPVALPVAALLGGIGTVRAHLYASFHSGRLNPAGPDSARPIARDTLAILSGVGRRSQRAYERKTGLKAHQNMAIGERTDLAARQKRAWKQGRALFELKDYRGYQGRKGGHYLAWQLPNSYEGCHPLKPKGRQKRINRELADLFTKGMTGNGKGTTKRYSARKSARIQARYFANGAMAAMAFSQSSVDDLYWPGSPTAGQRFLIWLVARGEP